MTATDFNSKIPTSKIYVVKKLYGFQGLQIENNTLANHALIALNDFIKCFLYLSLIRLTTEQD